LQLNLFSSSNLHEKATQIHERLCAFYGCPIPYFNNLDPLSELISALLSHRTKNADSHQAFQQLVEQFPNWEAVRDAPIEEVQAAIAPSTWPEMKAPRIQQVLRQIEKRRDGKLSLDFLAEAEISEARAWLEELAGVGAKTSAAVLAFSSLRRRVLVVDSHHYRVAARLNLIPANINSQNAHSLLEAQLPKNWSAQKVYDNHEVMMLHGQGCCHYRKPACDRCLLIDLCPHGQAQIFN
jgi:endonuclease III